MSQYQVSFYKMLLSPYGIPFRCLQAAIPIANAPTRSEAALAAERKFECSQGIPDWRLCADFFEVRPISRVLQPQCNSCGTSMLLVRREPHPALGDEFELRSFECATCHTFAQVDYPMSHKKNKGELARGAVIQFKPTDNTSLLLRRMAILGIDSIELDSTDPLLFRELQGLCSLCQTKARCAADLDHHVPGVNWRDYCANAATLSSRSRHFTAWA
jgi:hypothetical protein